MADVMKGTGSGREGVDDSGKDHKAELGQLKQEMKSIPFDTLLRAREALGGSKKRKREANREEASNFNSDDSDLSHDESDLANQDARKHERRKLEKRSSKHAPTELPSSKPVSRKRDVVGTSANRIRDPRFDDIGGHGDPEKASKNYAFVTEYQANEVRQLSSEIKKTKDPVARAELERKLKSLSKDRKEKLDSVLKEHKASERDKAKQTGKSPYYLKKSEQRRLFQEKEFEELQGTKKLDKLIEKRRRKRAQKEKKRLPVARNARQ